MGKRTTYMKVSQADSKIISGAWAAHPKIKKNVVNDIIFGWEGKDSEPNSVALARYAFVSDLLSEPNPIIPVDKGLRPRKLAVHPGGDGVVISFETGCRLFEWKEPFKPTMEVELNLQPSETVLTDMENIGPQNCLLFSSDGSLLASGGEDGCIRVFRWPRMEVVLKLPEAISHKSITDLDISLNSTFLSATAENGPCRVWDISNSEIVANLQPGLGEIFGFLRFSRHERKAFLYISMTKEKKGCIGVWDFRNWNRIGSRKFLAEPISSLAISHSGRHLAMGTMGGDIFIVEIEKMQIEQTVKNAHIGGVTSLEFSLNNKALLSLSSDYSSRVTALDLSKEWQEWQMYLLLVGLVLFSAVVFYLFFAHGDSFFQAPVGRHQPHRPPIETIVYSDELLNYREHEEL